MVLTIVNDPLMNLQKHSSWTAPVTKKIDLRGPLLTNKIDSDNPSLTRKIDPDGPLAAALTKTSHEMCTSGPCGFDH